MSKGFDRAMEFVMRWEGGLVDNPDDAGGVTNFGISKRSFPNLDIENLTKEQAIEIYRKEYWDRCKCDSLPEQVALVVFDEAVNQGCRAAACDLQEACGVVVDGLVGPLTILAANTEGRYKLVRAVIAERMERYRKTVLTRPENEVFIEGWQNRAEACLEEACREEVLS